MGNGFFFVPFCPANTVYEKASPAERICYATFLRVLRRGETGKRNPAKWIFDNKGYIICLQVMLHRWVFCSSRISLTDYSNYLFIA